MCVEMVPMIEFTPVAQMSSSAWSNMVQNLMQPNITLLTSAKVDEKMWYTVKLSMPVANWMRQQETTKWEEHYPANSWAGQNIFDVEETLYTLLNLKWK